MCSGISHEPDIASLLRARRVGDTYVPQMARLHWTGLASGFLLSPVIQRDENRTIAVGVTMSRLLDDFPGDDP